MTWSRLMVAACLPLLFGCPISAELWVPPDPNARANEICTNEIDDDQDGAVDCADDNCRNHPSCGGVGSMERFCDDGLDDDGDGLIDCDDPDCLLACEVPRETSCADGLDDDGDHRVDCDDDDCAQAAACAVQPEHCSNGRDDDGDGAIDCADADCTGTPACRPIEDCGNGLDDDGDGAFDCDDPECDESAACPRLEQCDNGIDDDENGATDCDDPACVEAPDCIPVVAPGALVFTEVMANPSTGGGDPAHEWFELFNTTDASIDLEGWSFIDGGASSRPHVIRASVTIAPGVYVVLAYSATDTLGFVPAYLYGPGAFSINNRGERLELRAPDGAVIDAIDTSLPDFPIGAAGETVESRALDAEANDLAASWCVTAASPYNTSGERGTPGAASSCVEEVPTDRPPSGGEVVVTEVLYDALTTEPHGEWFEVLSVASEPIDLKGCVLTSGASTFPLTGSLPLLPGERHVFCRSLELGPPGCTSYTSLSFANTADDVGLLAPDGTLVDQLAYLSGAPWPSVRPGFSIQLTQRAVTAALNDDPENWCTAGVDDPPATPFAAGPCP